MVGLALVFGFTLAFVSSMAPTGPISLLVIERGLSRRYREGRGIAAGAALAEGLYAALGAFGVSALFVRFPSIELGARVASVVILVVLGVRFVRYRAKLPSFEVGVEVAGGDTTRAPASSQHPARSFALGLSIALANPVLVVAWSTTIALLLSLGQLRFDVADRIAFAAAVPFGITMWFTLLLGLLRRREGQVTVQIAQRILQGAGVLILATAAFFAASIVMKALGS